MRVFGGKVGEARNNIRVRRDSGAGYKTNGKIFDSRHETRAQPE
jgi:hypothetical protein